MNNVFYKIAMNRLLRTDLLLSAGVVGLLIAGDGILKGILQGFCTAALIFAIGNHVTYYRQTKKLF